LRLPLFGTDARPGAARNMDSDSGLSDTPRLVGCRDFSAHSGFSARILGASQRFRRSTWSARKTSSRWHGGWSASTAQGRSFAGSWDADMAELKDRTFVDMLTRTLEKEMLVAERPLPRQRVAQRVKVQGRNSLKSGREFRPTRLQPIIEPALNDVCCACTLAMRLLSGNVPQPG
jgi:hypothetical protein